MYSEKQNTCIFQTGRLGDLWMTLPMANDLFQRSNDPIPVYYDKRYGPDVFHFFPYVEACPIDMPDRLPERNRLLRLINQGFGQWITFRGLKKRYPRVIWNQIFPWRWFQACAYGRPYPDYWYRHNPKLAESRCVPTTLQVTQGQNILVFLSSQSLPRLGSAENAQWLERNLQRLVDVTGLDPLVVACGDQPDHPGYKTWRGSLIEYQQLIAGSALIFGIITSAHVLGQVLGKPVVALYGKNTMMLDRIGQETAFWVEGNDWTDASLKRIQTLLPNNLERDS